MTNFIEKKRARMRQEKSHPGRIANYLLHLTNDFGEDGPSMAANLEADIASTFSTPEGIRVLIMLEKAILLSSSPDGSDDRALREDNAARNLTLELRRYAAHG